MQEYYGLWEGGGGGGGGKEPYLPLNEIMLRGGIFIVLFVCVVFLGGKDTYPPPQPDRSLPVPSTLLGHQGEFILRVWGLWVGGGCGWVGV